MLPPPNPPSPPRPFGPLGRLRGCGHDLPNKIGIFMNSFPITTNFCSLRSRRAPASSGGVGLCMEGG